MSFINNNPLNYLQFEPTIPIDLGVINDAINNYKCPVEKHTSHKNWA